MTLLLDKNEAQIHHKTWIDLLDVMPKRPDGAAADTLIVDAPYSDRVHGGHDTAAKDGDGRRALNYTSWSPDDVGRFVEAWAPRIAGWFVSITDHALARSWESHLSSVGRYVFAPIPFVAPGSNVRITGDGPSCWATWIVVARPRSRPYSTWGTLPGAYVLPPGYGERMAVVGGKPLWLMERLVEDYSRPGDLIVDPCCGAGTTIRAAQLTGRRGVGGDQMLEHARIAAARCASMAQVPLFMGGR